MLYHYNYTYSIVVLPLDVKLKLDVLVFKCLHNVRKETVSINFDIDLSSALLRSSQTQRPIQRWTLEKAPCFILSVRSFFFVSSCAYVYVIWAFGFSMIFPFPLILGICQDKELKAKQLKVRYAVVLAGVQGLFPNHIYPWMKSKHRFRRLWFGASFGRFVIF